MSLTAIRVVTSPLVGDICVIRVGKDPRLALERRPAEAEVFAAVTEHMMFDAPKGATKAYRVGDQWYEMTVKPLAGNPEKN